jgi:hypothetical protein
MCGIASGIALIGVWNCDLDHRCTGMHLDGYVDSAGEEVQIQIRGLPAHQPTCPRAWCLGETWTALLAVVLNTPHDAERLRKNPFGALVHAINWSRGARLIRVARDCGTCCNRVAGGGVFSRRRCQGRRLDKGAREATHSHLRPSQSVPAPRLDLGRKRERAEIAGDLKAGRDTIPTAFPRYVDHSNGPGARHENFKDGVWSNSVDGLGPCCGTDRSPCWCYLRAASETAEDCGAATYPGELVRQRYYSSFESARR